jgi:DNA repair protein RecO (recombination protein O)
MTHKTKGIVLRSVKYGETSLILTILTELFGLQTFIVSGIRTNKKTGNKAAMFQPSSILDLEVYYNEQKQINRIKDASWAVLYQNIFNDVVKNSVGLFMVELLQKTIKQPENDPDLFYFCEDCLKELDLAKPAVTANMPLYFSLQLTHFFGFKIETPVLTDRDNLFLDLYEGTFSDIRPPHSHFIQGEFASLTAELLKVIHPRDLDQVPLNQTRRRELLRSYLEYYALHFPDFGKLKTLDVMYEVLN